MARLLVCLVVFVAGVGCTSTTVKQNPGPHDHGFRFYRPKPYLFITPVPSTDAKDAPEFVKIEWQMLPDFSEQYSVHARAGFGVNNTKVTLDNGWNLTKIDFDMDSKTDENIKAVGSLIKSVGGAFGASAADGAVGKKHLVTARMPARNVPLGLYEAVIDRDPSGVKRLYGWRYVGFVPYAPCPVDGSGSQAENCALGQIYGLVSEGGVMVFKRLEDIGQEPLEPATVRPPGPASKAELQAAVDAPAVAAVLLTAAQGAVTPGNTVTGVRATAVDKATLKFDVSVGLAVPLQDQLKTSTAVRNELQKAVRVQKGLARVDVAEVNLLSPKQ